MAARLRAGVSVTTMVGMGGTGGGAGIAGAGVGGQPTLGRGYPYYSHRYSCRYYGFGDNCPYYELPDWNGPMEIRNPGG